MLQMIACELRRGKSYSVVASDDISILSHNSPMPNPFPRQDDTSVPDVQSAHAALLDVVPAYEVVLDDTQDSPTTTGHIPSNHSRKTLKMRIRVNRISSTYRMILCLS